MESKIVYMPYILAQTADPLLVEGDESDIEKIREKYVCKTKEDLSFYCFDVIESIDDKDLTE